MHAESARPSGTVEVGTPVLLRRSDEADADEFLARVATSRDLHDRWVRPPGAAGGVPPRGGAAPVPAARRCLAEPSDVVDQGRALAPGLGPVNLPPWTR